MRNRIQRVCPSLQGVWHRHWGAMLPASQWRITSNQWYSQAWTESTCLQFGKLRVYPILHAQLATSSQGVFPFSHHFLKCPKERSRLGPSLLAGSLWSLVLQGMMGTGGWVGRVLQKRSETERFDLLGNKKGNHACQSLVSKGQNTSYFRWRQ